MQALESADDLPDTLVFAGKNNVMQLTSKCAYNAVE
jgi:hypothetical protein